MKTILVTGGANGIGKAVCEHLLSQGYRVIILDIDRPNAEAICRKNEDRCLFIYADLTTTEGVVQAFKQIDQYPFTVDALINNAGKGMVKPLTELSDKNRRRVWPDASQPVAAEPGMDQTQKPRSFPIRQDHQYRINPCTDERTPWRGICDV